MGRTRRRVPSSPPGASAPPKRGVASPSRSSQKNRFVGCVYPAAPAAAPPRITSSPPADADLILVRANCRGACRSCNYRRGDTPANQLDELRRCTPTQLDEKRARRHIASRHRTTAKKAPAEAFFNVSRTPQ